MQGWMYCHCGFRDIVSCGSNCIDTYTLSLIQFPFALFLFVENFCSILTSTSFQTIVTQINHAIGAAGVVSLECKAVVFNYGNIIWDYLMEGVGSFNPFTFSSNLLNKNIQLLLRRWRIHFPFLQIRPEIVCVDLGLCSSNGSHHVR